LRKKLIPAGARNRVFERFTGTIDWRQTKVYPGAQDEQAIYVNLAGRDPEGAVNPGPEYENFLEQLTAGLLALVDPATGESVIEQVLRKEEVLSGDQLHDAPDLFVFTRDREYEIVDLYDDSPLVLNSPSRSGQHRSNGILMAAGHGIDRGADLQGASIMDLLPTILYALDLPVPDDVDGRALVDIFAPEFVQGKELVFAESTETLLRSEMPELYSAADEEDVERRLRGLGYL
jgi:predicted AlkP superfamily phosphohydrolase/phosphomutase